MIRSDYRHKTLMGQLLSVTAAKEKG